MARFPKRPVTARIMVSPSGPNIKRLPERTYVGGSHDELIKEATAEASGGYIPHGCQLKYTKLRRLPGRRGGADAVLVCEVARVYSVAYRNPKRKLTMAGYSKKKRR